VGHENGPAKVWEVWATLCHQILCKAWRIRYCDLWKVIKDLWRTFPIQGTSVQMAQVPFRRPRTSRRRTSCGKTFNLKNGRQCGKSEASCEVRSSIDVEKDQQWDKFEPVYRPSNFNTAFGHKKSVRQDGSKEFQDWAEGQSEGCVSWSSGPPWEGARLLQSRYHRRWIMDFGVRPRDKTPKSGVAHRKFSPFQESEKEQMQNQINSNLFFWQLGDRPQWICATRTNCQSKFLSGILWKTQEKGGTCATRHCRHLDAAPRQRPMSHGSLHQW